MKESKNIKQATALKYDENKHKSPVVAATGRGYVAENILDKAKKYDIPILEDPTLVELLSKLDVNERIPEELYHVVAEVFAFIYQIDKQAGKGKLPKS